MILYLEKQLDDAYDIYRRHQIKQDASFISKENFIHLSNLSIIESKKEAAKK